MSYLQNLHTHSTYCDGIHTPEEMVNFAIEKGFDSLGFSGHAYMFYSNYAGLSVERTQRYKKEVTALKTRYADRLKIFLGLEVDIYSDEDRSDYDYLIGSVHYLKQGDTYIPIDRSKVQFLLDVIDTYFGGDSMSFVKAYYETLSKLPQYGSFDIIGHFDLITKHIETQPLFDVTSKEYVTYALEAMEALRPHIDLFEVNTGAMARGYRHAPYPSAQLCRELHNMGFGAVITSDCHDGTKLDIGFDNARELLRSCGFKEQYILTDTGFKAIAL